MAECIRISNKRKCVRFDEGFCRNLERIAIVFDRKSALYGWFYNVINDEKTQDKPVRNVKRQSNKTTQRNKIKVTITNIDDNYVFHTIVRIFGRFVKCDNSMSIESQLKKNKGVIYLDNEQELDDLLDTLLMYNLSDGHVPIQIQVE